MYGICIQSAYGKIPKKEQRQQSNKNCKVVIEGDIRISYLIKKRKNSSYKNKTESQANEDVLQIFHDYRENNQCVVVGIIHRSINIPTLQGKGSKKKKTHQMNFTDYRNMVYEAVFGEHISMDNSIQKLGFCIR